LLCITELEALIVLKTYATNHEGYQSYQYYMGYMDSYPGGALWLFHVTLN